MKKIIIIGNDEIDKITKIIATKLHLTKLHLMGIKEATRLHPSIFNLNLTERRKKKVIKFKFKYKRPGKGETHHTLEIKAKPSAGGNTRTITTSVYVSPFKVVKPFLVTAVAVIQDTKVICDAVGLSRCSEHDKFDFFVGEKIALSRAMKALSMKILGIPISGNDLLMG